MIRLSEGEYAVYTTPTLYTLHQHCIHYTNTVYTIPTLYTLHQHCIHYINTVYTTVYTNTVYTIHTTILMINSQLYMNKTFIMRLCMFI